MFLRRIQDVRTSALVAGMSLLLAGCQGMYLHNPDRAAVATTAKNNIDTVDVKAIAKTEQENLAAMLAQETKSIDERSKLVASLALVQFAVAEQSADTHYSKAIGKVASTFGTKNMLELKAKQDCGIKLEGAIEQDDNLKGAIEAYGATKIPACKPGLPGTLAPPGDLKAEEVKEFNKAYAKYADHCNDPERSCPSLDANGSLEKAMLKLADANRQAKQQKDEVKKARAAYEKALNENKARTQSAASTEKDIQDKAQHLLDTLNKLASISPSLGNQVKGQALVELLTAAAGGKADSNDPDLAPALELARSLPSLAQSIDAAKAAKAQVPVSPLLLALNNLLIASDRDERLAALDAEEVAVLQRKLAALQVQVKLWRHYSDNLCNLAMLADGKGYPRQACDTIEFAGQGEALSCTIRFKKGPNVQIDKCVLGKSWRALFKGPLVPPVDRAKYKKAVKELKAALEKHARDEAQAKRALYEAVAAYLQVRLDAYAGTAEEFRRIDIAQRRTVVQREAALAQWKNVVAIPAMELEAYYKGGTKPAEIADLLVKALGFTAIAIGVSK